MWWGQKTKIDTDDIKKMDYLICVLKETLRLHAPSPFLTPRETTEDVKIGGYHAPAKTRVLINLWAIQRDESVRDRSPRGLRIARLIMKAAISNWFHLVSGEGDTLA